MIRKGFKSSNKLLEALEKLVIQRMHKINDFLVSQMEKTSISTRYTGT